MKAVAISSDNGRDSFVYVFEDDKQGTEYARIHAGDDFGTVKRAVEWARTNTRTEPTVVTNPEISDDALMLFHVEYSAKDGDICAWQLQYMHSEGKSVSGKWFGVGRGICYLARLFATSEEDAIRELERMMLASPDYRDQITEAHRDTLAEYNLMRDALTKLEQRL